MNFIRRCTRNSWCCDSESFYGRFLDSKSFDACHKVYRTLEIARRRSFHNVKMICMESSFHLQRAWNKVYWPVFWALEKFLVRDMEDLIRRSNERIRRNEEQIGQLTEALVRVQRGVQEWREEALLRRERALMEDWDAEQLRQERAGTEDWDEELLRQESPPMEEDSAVLHSATSEGLSKAEMEALPRQILDFSSLGESNDRKMEQEQCPTCHDEFLQGQTLIRLACCHMYHPECITPWLTSHDQCPYCRGKLVRTSENRGVA